MHIRPTSDVGVWYKDVRTCWQLICSHIEPLAICAEVRAWNNRRSKIQFLEKANTEYGLCSLESDWYVKRNLTDYNAPTQAIWHYGGRRLREKALHRLEIKSAVYKKLFGPPVARLRRLASAKGLLNRNSLWISIQSQTPNESVRWPAFESPMVKDKK